MVANILICLQQRDWGTANNLSKIQQTSNRIRNCTNLLAAALVLHAQSCIIWGHQITDRWLGKLKHGEWRGIKERFVLFCYPAWHSILLALNNCSTYISTRPIQNEMNQVQEVPFFCPHFQGKLSEQSHWRRYWQYKCLNFTEWEFCARPLCTSLCNNNTKTTNTPLKIIPIETQNWASIYPNSDF